MAVDMEEAYLVGLEVEGELGVVPLDDDLGGLLDGLGANATHDCCRAVLVRRKKLVRCGCRSSSSRLRKYKAMPKRTSIRLCVG